MAVYPSRIPSDKLSKQGNESEDEKGTFLQDRRIGRSTLIRSVQTTLKERDLDNLLHILSLGTEQFNDFYDNLDEGEKTYVYSLLENYRLDIIDYVIDNNILSLPNANNILGKIWK